MGKEISNQARDYKPVQEVFQIGAEHLAMKNISRFLYGITPKHIDDYYCKNCLHSFRTESRFKSHKSVCRNHFVTEKCLRHRTKYLSLIKDA